MAIRVLLDHNVPEDKIALLSLLVSKQGSSRCSRQRIVCISLPSGVQTVAYAFPKVKIVTTACDGQLDPETGFICPGLGNFGDRYFGTDPVVSDTEETTFGVGGVASSPADISVSPQIPSKSIHLHRDASPPVALRSTEQDDVFSTI